MTVAFTRIEEHRHQVSVERATAGLMVAVNPMNSSMVSTRAWIRQPLMTSTGCWRRSAAIQLLCTLPGGAGIYRMPMKLVRFKSSINVILFRVLVLPLTALGPA